MPPELLNSKAICEIKGAMTIRALLRFYQKRRWIKRRQKIDFIDEPLAFTYAEAQELGIGRSRFHEIIQVLHRLGFIDIEHQGGGLMKDYSRYRISERYRKYGTPDFEHREKKKSVRHGRDIATLKRRKDKRESMARKANIVTVESDCHSRSSVTVRGEP